MIQFKTPRAAWLGFAALQMAACLGCRQWELPTLGEQPGHLPANSAWQKKPAPEPPPVAAFASPDVSERREALAWWNRFGEEVKLPELPAEAKALARDADPRVRAELATAISHSDDPEAAALVLSILHDQDLAVRLAAIAALARIPAEPEQEAQIREKLATLLKEDLGHGEKVRSAAAATLVRRRCWPEVATAAEDRSFRVRAAVAQQLGGGDSAIARSASSSAASAALPNFDDADHLERKQLADMLIADPHPAVQQATIAAVATWPLSEAGALWMTALESEVFQTRAAAYKQLSARWPAARGFPFDARLAVERSIKLKALHTQWDLAAVQLAEVEARVAGKINAVTDALANAKESTVRTVSHVTTARRAAQPAAVAGLRILLRAMQQPGADARQQREWKLQLANLGPDLLPALEQLYEEDQAVIGEFVFREILPEHGPVYKALGELARGSNIERRRAAHALETLSSAQPLSALALSRMATLAEAEQDGLVWQSLLAVAAAAQSAPGGAGLPPTESASRLPDRFWQLALEQDQAEVRRRACEQVGQMKRVQLAAALAPLVNDPDNSVARAAAKAFGNLGPLPDTEPLEQLLAAKDHAIRVEAATSLCKAGSHAGAAAISRLSYDADPAIRQQVAESIGSLGDRQFLSILIRFLDDARSVQRAALIALPKVVGTDETLAASGDSGTPPTTTQQIAAWKAWHEEQSRTRLRIVERAGAGS